MVEMSLQLGLSENEDKWEHVKSDKKRLQRLHTSEEMSIFEMAYKFDVPVDTLENYLKHFDIHMIAPLDWKEDKDVLRKVAKDGAESEFCDLLSGRVTSRHVKDRIEIYGIKSYENDHTDKETFRQALNNHNSVEEVADEFEIHEKTVESWSKKHFDKKPEKFMSQEATLNENEDSQSLNIDVDSVLERGDISVETTTDGTSIKTTVEFVVDDIITIEKESTVDVVDVEAELKKKLM